MTKPSPSPRTVDDCAPAGFQNTIQPLLALLRQLHEVIGTLSPQQYAQEHERTFKSSIGGHVRHSLDHIAALLAGVREGLIDYDARQRGTDIESQRNAALDAMRQLDDQLADLGDDDLARCVRVRLSLSADAPPHEVNSSIGREAAFVMSHTIHHNAIIAAMARGLGVEPPAAFGFAPSTLAYMRRQGSCAQ